jgi:hypothetical protein
MLDDEENEDRDSGVAEPLVARGRRRHLVRHSECQPLWGSPSTLSFIRAAYCADILST